METVGQLPDCWVEPWTDLDTPPLKEMELRSSVRDEYSNQITTELTEVEERDVEDGLSEIFLP
jgi:hypothetical protein